MIRQLFSRQPAGWRQSYWLSWQTAVFIAATAALAYLLLLRFRLWVAAPAIFLFVLYVMGELRYLRAPSTSRLLPDGVAAMENLIEQVLYEKGLPYQYENGRFQLNETQIIIQAIPQQGDHRHPAQTKLLITPLTRDNEPLIHSLQTRFNQAHSEG